MDERRIRWLCRRGMKELDVMLAAWMDRGWPEADDAERKAFAALLDLQDPVLWDLLVARMEAPDVDIRRVIERIRTLSGL